MASERDVTPASAGVRDCKHSAEIEEALRFLRAHKCQCCGQFKSNCVCWANFDMTGSRHCTPASHGRDGYGW